MGRSRDLFIGQVGGFEITELPQEVKEAEINKILEEPMTIDSYRKLAILKNGGTCCEFCGFHIIDECICG